MSDKEEFLKKLEAGNHSGYGMAEAEEIIARLCRMVRERDKAIKEAEHALHRMRIGVKWSDNPEWFDEVHCELIRLKGGEGK